MGRNQLILLAVLMVAASFIGGAVASRAFSPKAKEFLVIDANGNVRAGLGLSKDGSSVLEFRDANGNVRVGLGLTPEGSSVLGFRDANGNMRVWLGITPKDLPYLWFTDEEESPIWSAP